MRLNLEVSDPDVLAQLRAGLVDLRPGLERIADDFLDRERAQFASARGWDALDPETVRRKGNSRVLVKTGGLLRSLTRPNDRYAVRKITGDSLEVGSKNPVANLHRAGARGMPVRDPVPRPTSAERTRWGRMLLDGIGA